VRHSRIVAATIALLACAAGRALGAQTVTLTTTGANAPMTTPALADYTAGFVTLATPITYTLKLNSGRSNCTYTVLVQVKASAATIGSSKLLSDLQWSTTGGYTGFTTTYVTVGTHTLTTASTTASASVRVRMLLNWTDTAISYAGTSLGFQTSGTAAGTGC
jgi:hypothetical protein